MNAMIKIWLVLGLPDALITIYTYSVLAGSWFVLMTIFPTIMVLGIGLPLQRMMNQIDRQFKKQNGICYNCNMRINDKDTAVLEDETGKVYCHNCHQTLYGHLYEKRNGVWYRKDEK